MNLHPRSPRTEASLKPYTLGMPDINATTPQLKAVKGLFDAYASLDVKNAEQYISKDFKFHTFPKIPDLPEETKGSHFERYGALLSYLMKVEVRVRHCGTSFTSSSWLISDQPPTPSLIFTK